MIWTGLREIGVGVWVAVGLQVPRTSDRGASKRVWKERKQEVKMHSCLKSTVKVTWCQLAFVPEQSSRIAPSPSPQDSFNNALNTDHGNPPSPGSACRSFGKTYFTVVHAQPLLSALQQSVCHSTAAPARLLRQYCKKERKLGRQSWLKECFWEG